MIQQPSALRNKRNRGAGFDPPLVSLCIRSLKAFKTCAGVKQPHSDGFKLPLRLHPLYQNAQHCPRSCNARRRPASRPSCADIRLSTDSQPVPALNLVAQVLPVSYVRRPPTGWRPQVSDKIAMVQSVRSTAEMTGFGVQTARATTSR